MDITWKNIFNTNHCMWFIIDEAMKEAHKCGYPYFIWNDRIYKTNGEYTGLTIDNIF